MFFESLESRHMMAVAPGDIGTIWETYQGNYMPAVEFKAATPNFLTSPQAGEDLAIAINYLKQNAASFGALPADFDHHIVTNEYTDAATGVSHIYLQQKFNGLPVADAVANVNITRHGQVLTASANFVRNLANNNAPVPAQPAITAISALINLGIETSRQVYGTEPENLQIVGGQSQKVIYSGSDAATMSVNPIPIELHYVPKPAGGVELAWKITALNPDGSHWFEASIGAQNGQRVGQVIRLTDWVSHAAYNVFPQPVDDIVDGPRRVVINPHSGLASPFGWHDIDGVPGPEYTDLRGNNVSAQEDINGDLAGGTRPNSPILEFNDFLFLQADPLAYTDASTTNLFYWTNLVHDITFHHGFDEASGNFQVENYNNVGQDTDAVLAYSQSALATNNAFMATPPDGQPPLLVMGLTTQTLPRRDTALDSVIIIHEYAHGISNRLTGGPANSNALLSLQSGGMGEGWSDWLGLLLTIDPGDTKNTPRALSEWSFGLPGGIRRQPYSFDMAINSLTLEDFNGFDPGGFPNSEVHNAGEIWASALWDLSWLMIERYGFSNDWFNGNGGNNRVMDLVLEGMKLQPANPSFTEARDAILAADLALNDSANFEMIWQAFSRRGFGVNAFDGGGAASDVVTENFNFPNPLTRVTGRVVEDVNGNGQINSGDGGLAGWTVYVDVNNNGSLNLGERSAVTAADGSYSLPITTQGSFAIREIVQPGYKRIVPSSGSYTVNTSSGANIKNRNFLNQQLPGGISGVKFHDLDGSGVRDPGEPGIQGVMIYVDYNRDGRLGVLEAGAVTDVNGNYTISNVRAGTYQLREVAQPGLVQTFPDPANEATLGGAHVAVTVVSNAITQNINFGNRQAIDFGDAPNSYGTLLANNGPRHGILAGFGIGATGAAVPLVDAEPNGQPTANANGDDAGGLTGNDETSGVTFFGGLVPGQTGSVEIATQTGSFGNGYLHAWVDFNRDGDFLDAGEKIISNVARGTGAKTFTFPVPANTQLGNTFARVRFGFERDLSPLGAALAGEVVDLPVDVLLNRAVATADIFPDRNRVPADPFIKLNSTFGDVGNSLDVLRNDFGTSAVPQPLLIASDFTGPGNTLTTTAGGTIRYNGPTAPLTYQPRPGYTGPDSFTYRVTDGTTPSAPATVSITVSPSDPIAIDDLFRIAPGATPRDIRVLDNDLSLPGQPIRIVGTPVLLSSATGGTLQVPTAGDKLIFTPTANFQGTVRYRYTIDDIGDASTAPVSAIVTIQVTPNDDTPAASHAAIFSAQYIAADSNGQPTGGPTNVINRDNSPFFFVQLTVNDPAGITPAGLPQTTGVESAYVDFLIRNANPLLPQLAEPVILPNGRFDITFDSQFTLVRQDNPDFSTPGFVNEVGATHDASLEPNPPSGSGNGPQVVMLIKFRALGNGQVTIQPDHADSGTTTIALFDPSGDPAPGTIPITDEQVFIELADPLQIIGGGSGEGEFTNFSNVYDVNDDQAVDPLDILVLINDLTLFGSRPLSQLAISAAGSLPSGYLDTNVDAQVNALDMLGIINYLTSRPTLPTGLGGEGEAASSGENVAEGEAPPAAFAALAPQANDAAIALALQPLRAQEQPAAAVADLDSADDELLAQNVALPQPSAPVATADDSEAESAGGKVNTDAVDSQAADELFARLSDMRGNLLAGRLARR